MKAKKYYAYFIPEDDIKGVTDEWKKCEQIVIRKKEARFKSFKTKEEAREWLQYGADYGFRAAKSGLETGIYFDAGTGRGQGVEISVTDERGGDLLKEILPKARVNRFGKHRIFKNATNNYGELLACKYALQLALKRDIKKVFGDSKLVIEYWSRGMIKRSPTLTLPSMSPAKRVLPQETVDLALSVSKLRKEFEKAGGSMKYISGEDNPADLGFHR